MVRMAQWTNVEFDAAADGIAQSFFAGHANNGASLNELATKCARDNALNPEQISRLCKLVNTRTFETKLAAMQGDKYVEFPVADADVVSSALMKTAALAGRHQDPYPALPDGLASLRETPEPEGMKIASAHTNAMRVCAALKSEPVDVQHHKAKLAAERHKDGAERAEVEWAEALRAVVAKTAGIRWDHDAFEKSALVATDGEGLYELNQIRETLGMPPLEVPEGKMAELLDRVEAADSAAAQLIGRATRARKACAEHLAKQASAEADRDRLWAETLKGLRET